MTGHASVAMTGHLLSYFSTHSLIYIYLLAFPGTSLVLELMLIGNLLLYKLKVSVLLFSDNLSFMEFLQ
jgi:hypothetical protein